MIDSPHRSKRASAVGTPGRVPQTHNSLILSLTDQLEAAKEAIEIQKLENTGLKLNLERLQALSNAEKEAHTEVTEQARMIVEEQQLQKVSINQKLAVARKERDELALALDGAEARARVYEGRWIRAFHECLSVKLQGSSALLSEGVIADPEDPEVQQEAVQQACSLLIAALEGEDRQAEWEALSKLAPSLPGNTAQLLDRARCVADRAPSCEPSLCPSPSLGPPRGALQAVASPYGGRRNNQDSLELSESESPLQLSPEKVARFTSAQQRLQHFANQLTDATEEELDELLHMQVGDLSTAQEQVRVREQGVLDSNAQELTDCKAQLEQVQVEMAEIKAMLRNKLTHIYEVAKPLAARSSPAAHTPASIGGSKFIQVKVQHSGAIPSPSC